MTQQIHDLFASLKCGSVEIIPFAVIDGERIQGTVSEQLIRQERSNARLALEKPGIFRDALAFNWTGEHFCCRRQFQNLTGKKMKLHELGFRISGIDFGGKKRDDFFYHNENPRIYEVMAFPVDYKRTAKDAKDSEFDIEAGNRWADPGVVCDHIGRSLYQPFPAILLGNYQSTHGLVHGTLSQKVFYHSYLAFHEKDDLVMDIFSGFKGTEYLEVKPGRILTDEWYLGSTEQADQIEHIFDGYTKVLRKHLPPMYGATEINRDNLVWGSWNDGIGRRVTEDLVLREAEFVKKHFPTVRWIQLDDGYANRGLEQSAHGLGVPYEGEEGIDHKKFPGGLRAFTDKIRIIGLRPAIWIGGECPKDTKVFEEKPQWFSNYDYRVTDIAPFDVSKPEVRDYMTFALDKLITEYGFEGVKQDFWSYVFEDSHDLFSGKECSGYQWRDWWLKEFRHRLPADGYFQTGCDIVMGNPFLGEFYTNYRYGIDVGSGKWDYIRTNYLWGIACFATHTGDLFVPNSDAIGILKRLSDDEVMFWTNYCMVTHSMVEIAGRLSEYADSSRFSMLKKASCNPNNGQDVYFGHWDYRNPKEKYPLILYCKTAHFCSLENQEGLPLRTVGLFNPGDVEQTVSFDIQELALDCSLSFILTDVWSGEPMPLTGRMSFTLPPHGSRLLAVSATGPAELLDSDIRICRACRKGNTLILQTDYEAEATLCFSSKVTALTFDGKAQPFTMERCLLRCHIPGKGCLETSF